MQIFQTLKKSNISSINNEEWYRKKYEVDEVHFNDKNTIIETLTNLHAKQLLLLVKFLFSSFNHLLTNISCNQII